MTCSVLLFGNPCLFSLAFLKLILTSVNRTVQSSLLSIKDQKEKANRSEFVQGLLLSTILEDYS